MMISTKGRYALRIMIALALQDTASYIPLKTLAKAQDISEKYLESIMKTLTAGGMVASLRGKGGGYRLAKPPESYTTGSILKLAEGSLAPVACLEESASEACPRMEKCPTLPLWQGLNACITEYLESITLADLAEQARQTNELDKSVRMNETKQHREKRTKL